MDRKIQVLLIGDYPPPYGGIAIHVQQLHGYLREHGIQTRVLDIGKGGRPAPDVLPVRTALHLVTEVSRAAAQGWTLHLHTNGGNPKSWAITAAVGALARPFGGRSLVTLHSGLVPDYLRESTTRRTSARAALAGYGAIVAVSPAVQEALEVTGVPSGRVAVYPAFLGSAVRPGVLPERWAGARAKHQPLFSFAHHPSPVYGRELVFEALRRVSAARPEAGLCVFGPGTDSPEFWRDARAAGVEGRLVVLGDLPHAQALAVLQASDAFIRPTLADGDSISVREALALRVPCVASDAVVRPQGVVTFRTGQAQDLAEKLELALSRPSAPGTTPDAGGWLLERYRELAGMSGGPVPWKAPAAGAGA